MLKRLAKVPPPTWILFGLAWLAALWIITTPFTMLGAMRRPNLIDYASSLVFAALAAFALPHYTSRLKRSLTDTSGRTDDSSPNDGEREPSVRRWLSGLSGPAAVAVVIVFVGADTWWKATGRRVDLGLVIIGAALAVIVGVLLVASRVNRR